MRAVLLMLCLLAPACVRQPDVVRLRHAAETYCPQYGITVTEIGNHQWLARGCHTHAVYVCTHRRGPCVREGAMINED